MARRDRDSPDYEEEHVCGWGPFHPRWLQRFHNAICLVVCLMLTNIAHGILMAGFVPASVSQWTKKFGFTNQNIATIQSCFEFASIVGLILVSHYGNLGHKGRWLGLGAMLYSIGAFIYVIPQWASPPYDFAGASASGGGGPGGPGGPSRYCTLKPENFTCPVIPPGVPGGAPSGSGGPPPAGVGSDSAFPEPEEDTSSTSGIGDLRNWFYLLAFASCLRGLGSSPAFVLGPTYLDENVSQKRSPRLLGIMMSASGVGPLLGAALASVCLKIYGDVGKDIDLESILAQISPEDPRWYGAWWIGFLLAALLSFFFALPILGFARKLPSKGSSLNYVTQFEKCKEAAEERKNDVSQHLSSASTESAKSLADLPRAFCNLFRNYVFVLLVLGQVLLSMMMAGIMLFGPRLLEDLFAISSSTAILVMGLTGVLPASTGMAFGGWLISKLKLKCKAMLRYCALCSLITTPLLAIYLLHCDPLPVAGVVSVDYENMPIVPEDPKVLYTDCNTNCSCVGTGFQPVCDKVTGISYYSPCHAGCLDPVIVKEGIPAKEWDNCSCLDLTHTKEMLSALTPRSPGQVSLEPVGSNVVAGLCTAKCWKFSLFIGLLVVKGSVMGMSVPAMQQSQLRVVGIDQRTMALSMAWLVSRLLGIIPGQQIMGAIVDSACEYEGEKPPANLQPVGPDGCPLPGGPGGADAEGGPGGPPGPQCVRYDIHKLAVTISLFGIVVNGLATLTYALASILYKPAEEELSGRPEFNGEPPGPDRAIRMDRVVPGQEKPPPKKFTI